jgi:hypothetical protein
MLTGLKIPVMVGIGDPSCFGKQAHVLKEFLDSTRRLHAQNLARCVRQALESVRKTLR